MAAAKELCARAGRRNVTLKRGGATRHTIPVPVKGVAFRLSFAVIPHHHPDTSPWDGTGGLKNRKACARRIVDARRSKFTCKEFLASRDL